MQYQTVITRPFHQNLRVILPLKPRCIKGTFILCYSYSERESKMTRKSKKQFENQSQTEYMQNNQPQTMRGEAGKKNRIKTHSQSGRSMIEMLGVLAIIAILSIGGIVGYKLAMNYYQADQIANEINLMRNDLKVKYALGNEELLLGDPYDDTPENEDYSGHLSTQYDRYPVDYDCIRKDKAEFYNCRETDAYYIKVGNVSKGVCKPLTTLVSAMDGLMYIEINKKVYKEDDLCDEANEFYIQFDAEEVNGNYDSNRPEGWCAKDDDCPDDKPFCENKKCVECTPETGCESNTQHCENNECISCPEGKIWSGTACVDCMTDTDCADPDMPICKTDEHICVECKTNEDCFEKDTENPVCNTTEGKCEPCPEGESWKESAHGCAAYECRTNEDCTDGKYCYFKANGIQTDCTGEWNDKTQGGTCKDVNGAFQSITATIKNQEYIVSNESMTWWSACRLCAANAGRDDSDCVYPTTATPDFMLDASILECNPAVNINSKQGGCCYLNGTDISIGSSVSKEDLSDSINELRKTKGCDPNIKGYQGGNLMCPYHFWASNSFSNEYVYGIDMDSGYIWHNARNDGDYAFDFGGYAVCRQ